MSSVQSRADMAGLSIAEMYDVPAVITDLSASTATVTLDLRSRVITNSSGTVTFHFESNTNSQVHAVSIGTFSDNHTAGTGSSAQSGTLKVNWYVDDSDNLIYDYFIQLENALIAFVSGIESTTDLSANTLDISISGCRITAPHFVSIRTGHSST